MTWLGWIAAVVVLLVMGGSAGAETMAPPKPNTTDQQPSGTAPSSQTKAQGQTGQEIQEEPIDSTQQSQDTVPGTPKGKQQGDPRQGQSQPPSGSSVQ
jgi:hypothetical protein